MGRWGGLLILFLSARRGTWSGKTWSRALSTCAPDAYLILFYFGISLTKGEVNHGSVRGSLFGGMVDPDGLLPILPTLSSSICASVCVCEFFFCRLTLVLAGRKRYMEKMTALGVLMVRLCRHTPKINECLPRAISSGFRIKFMKVKCLVIDVIKYL